MIYVYVLVLIAVLAYGGVCGLLYMKQRSLLYHPSPAVELTDTKHITIHNAGQSLKTWVLNEGKTQAIIYFGGNAEGVEGNISTYRQQFSQHTVYLVNYRGYGGSSGHPNEKALFSDALVLYDKLKTQHSSFSLIGRSLGSGVATYLAAKRKIARLVLVTPYDSIVNVAQQMYSMFPVSWLLRDRFDSAALASGVTATTLLIIAENDEMISRQRSEALAAVFPIESISTVIIANHGHNSLSTDSTYNQMLEKFLNE